MISMFGAPKIRMGNETAPQPSVSNEGGLLAASMGPVFGIRLPVAGVAFAFLLLLAILYLLLFERKDED